MKKKGMVMRKNEGIVRQFSYFHTLWVWLVVSISLVCCCGTVMVMFGGRRRF